MNPEKEFEKWEYKNYGPVGLVDGYDVAKRAFLAAWEKQASRIRQLESQVLRMIRGEFKQICSYCGWESEEGQWEELQKHLTECPKHPLREKEERIKDMEEAIRSYEESQQFLLKKEDEYLKRINELKEGIKKLAPNPMKEG